MQYKSWRFQRSFVALPAHLRNCRQRAGLAKELCWKHGSWDQWLQLVATALDLVDCFVLIPLLSMHLGQSLHIVLPTYFLLACFMTRFIIIEFGCEPLLNCYLYSSPVPTERGNGSGKRQKESRRTWRASARKSQNKMICNLRPDSDSHRIISITIKEIISLCRSESSNSPPHLPTAREGNR